MSNKRNHNKIIAMLEIAESLAKLSTCSRLSVGAVITNTKFRILSSGYNGRPSGFTHCKDDNKDKLYEKCNCIHAEQNAIAYGSFNEEQKLAFVTAFPCTECLKLLWSIGVIEIYFIDPYKYFETSKLIADDYKIKYYQIKIRE